MKRKRGESEQWVRELAVVGAGVVAAGLALFLITKWVFNTYF